MFDKIWEWVRDTMLKWFGPPDIDDEPAFRKWVQESLSWFGWLAARTKTKIDDQVHDALATIVSDDDKWAVLYTLLVKLLGDGRIAVGSEPQLGNDADVAGASASLGIPVSLLIQLILFFLKMIRKD